MSSYIKVYAKLLTTDKITDFQTLSRLEGRSKSTLLGETIIFQTNIKQNEGKGEKSAIRITIFILWLVPFQGNHNGHSKYNEIKQSKFRDPPPKKVIHCIKELKTDAGETYPNIFQLKKFRFH